MDRRNLRSAGCILLGACIITVSVGCSATQSTGTSMQDNEDHVQSIAASRTDSQDRADEFPSHIERNISDGFQIDAEVWFPDAAVNGAVSTAKMADNNLWDMRESIRQALIPDGEAGETEDDEDGTDPAAWDFRCTSADGKKYLLIDGNGNMYYELGGTPTHVRESLDTDLTSSTYNANLYAEQDSFAFATKEEAWKEVRKFMDALGITQVSDEYQCYTMNYKTMAEQEKIIADAVEAELGKKLEVKNDWSEADNCYYFMSRQEWNGCAVLPAWQGEGTDFYNIYAMVDAAGVTEIQVRGYYPLEENGGKVSVAAPDKIVSSLKNYRDNLILNDTWLVDRIELGMKISWQGNDPHKGQLLPVWNCSIRVTDAGADSGTPYSSYQKYVSFYADTGEVVPD